MAWYDTLGAGAIGVVGNFLSGEKNYEYQQRAMREQMAWQEKMNAQQQDWQEMMWNKTNEYNTPDAQMQRLKEAGINPNVMYNGAGTMGSAQMASQPETPGAPSGFNPGFDLTSGLAQTALLEAQKKNIEADTEKKEEETKGQGIVNERGEMENSVWMTNWNVDVALRKSQIDLNKQQRDNLQFQFDVLFPQEEEMNEKQIDLLCGTGQKLAQEVVNLKKEQNLIEQKTRTEQAQQGVLAAQQDQIKATEAQIKEQTRGIRNENDVNEIIAKLSKETGIDVSKLQSIEQINLMLVRAGYNEEQIEAFWDATRGDLSAQFGNMLKRAFVDGSAYGSIATGAGVVVGAKGIGKGIQKFGVKKSNVNPGDGKWMSDIQDMQDQISVDRVKRKKSKK